MSKIIVTVRVELIGPLDAPISAHERTLTQPTGGGNPRFFAHEAENAIALARADVLSSIESMHGSLPAQVATTP